MVKLRCKRSGKPATGTVRLRFWFGLGYSDNPWLNLKSRKENRWKILSCFLFMWLDEVKVQRVHLGNPKTLRWQRPFEKAKTVYERDDCRPTKTATQPWNESVPRTNYFLLIELRSLFFCVCMCVCVYVHIYIYI